MIEKYVITRGINKGRVRNGTIAMELANTEDAWRAEPSPEEEAPDKPGKPKISINKLITQELRRLILLEITASVAKEFDTTYENTTKNSPSFG